VAVYNMSTAPIGFELGDDSWPRSSETRLPDSHSGTTLLEGSRLEDDASIVHTIKRAPRALAKLYGVNPKTIAKWEGVDFRFRSVDGAKDARMKCYVSSEQQRAHCAASWRPTTSRDGLQTFEATSLTSSSAKPGLHSRTDSISAPLSKRQG
jgi:hypothetical protein